MWVRNFDKIILGGVFCNFEFITRDKAVFLNRDDHKNTNFCTKRNQTCFANIYDHN